MSVARHPAPNAAIARVDFTRLQIGEARVVALNGASAWRVHGQLADAARLHRDNIEPSFDWSFIHLPGFVAILRADPRDTPAQRRRRCEEAKAAMLGRLELQRAA